MWRNPSLSLGPITNCSSDRAYTDCNCTRVTPELQRHGSPELLGSAFVHQPHLRESIFCYFRGVEVAKTNYLGANNQTYMDNWTLTLFLYIQHIKKKFDRVPHNTSYAKWNCLLCQRCATLRTESGAPLYPAPLECLPRPGLVIQVTPDLWTKVPARRSRLSFLIYNPSLPLVLFNPNLPWSKFSPDLTSSMLR